MNGEETSVVQEGTCIASRPIMEGGQKVGLMYREPPDDPGDSGWRFFTGQESEEDLEEPDNFRLCRVSDVVAADASILAHLDAPIPAEFERDPATGQFVDRSPRRPALQKACGIFGVAVIILTMAYAVLAGILYLPPYSWLADFQVRLFGGHITFLTWFLSMIPLLAAGLVVGLAPCAVFARAGVRRGEPWVTDVPRHAEFLQPRSRPLPGDTPSLRQANRWLQFGPASVAVLVGLGFLGYGVYRLTRLERPAAPVAVEAAALLASDRPAVQHVRLKGAHGIWDRRVYERPPAGFPKEAGHYYVPLVPPEPPPRRTALFLKVSGYDYEDATKATHFDGMLLPDGLPGEVRGKLRVKGIEPAASHLVLDYGATPDSFRFEYLLAIGIGGGVLLIGLVMAACQYVRLRRTEG